MSINLRSQLNRDEVIVAYVTEMIRSGFKLTKLRVKRSVARAVFLDSVGLYMHEIEIAQEADGVYVVNLPGPVNIYDVKVTGPINRVNPESPSSLEADSAFTRVLSVVYDVVHASEMDSAAAAPAVAETPGVDVAAEVTGTGTLFASKLATSAPAPSKEAADAIRATVNVGVKELVGIWDQLKSNLRGAEPVVVAWLDFVDPMEFETVARNFCTLGSTGHITNRTLLATFSAVAMHHQGAANMQTLMNATIAAHAQAIGRSYN